MVLCRLLRTPLRAAFLEAQGLATVPCFQCVEEGRPSVGGSRAFPPLLGLPLVAAVCWEPWGHQSRASAALGATVGGGASALGAVPTSAMGFPGCWPTVGWGKTGRTALSVRFSETDREALPQTPPVS